MSANAIRQPSVEEMQIGNVYAEAVWRVAVEQGKTDDLVEEFDSLIADVLDEEPQLEIFFSLGSISQEHRGEIVEKIFAGRASELMLNFLRTLNKHDRLGAVRAIGLAVRELWHRSQGTAPVLARTAVPLSADQTAALTKMITERFKIKPELRTEVDPSLLGGLWLRIGDTVYDQSVRLNLNQLRENILTRSSHEIQSGRNIVDRSEGN